jgi:hypothetical protein
VIAVFNRLLWSTIGLLCLAAGIAGLLGAGGLLGDWVRHHEVAAGLVRQAQSSGPSTLAWIGLGGVAAVILGVLLVRAELTRGPGAFSPDRRLRSSAFPTGTTRVRGRTLRRALERDLGRVRGVEAVRVSLGGSRDRQRLRLWLALDSDRDLAAVQSAILQARNRFATTTAAPVLAGDVTIRLRHPQRRTV